MMAELINEGKIGSCDLSHVNARTISRAHAVRPCAAAEVNSKESELTDAE